MAKRKQIPPSVNIDAVRWAVIAVIILVFFFLAVQAIAAFLYHARTFVIQDISISEGLGVVNVPELDRMKGLNIFTVDLGKVEEKIRSKYPSIGGIKVTRRFPDEVAVTGFKREPMAIVVVGGRSSVVSRDGFFIGPPNEETTGIAVIKGMKVSKIAVGTPVGDDQLGFAYSVLDVIRKDQGLAGIGFRSLDIHDPEKIVAVFGEGKATFEAFMDHERALSQLQMFAGMVGRMNLELSSIKYIDLRFEQPIIGQKKIKK